MKKYIYLPIMVLLLSLASGCNSHTSHTSSSEKETTITTSIIEDNGHKVSKEEYLDAFSSFEKETNYTVVENINLVTTDENSPGVLAGISGVSSFKVDGVKISSESDIGEKVEYTPEFFEYAYSSQGLTSEESKLGFYNLILNGLLSENAEILLQEKDHIVASLTLGDSVSYAESIPNDSLFGYFYEEVDGVDGAYYRSKQFKEEITTFNFFNDNSFVSIFGNEEMYSLLTLDEESNLYRLDDIQTLLEIVYNTTGARINDTEQLSNLEITVKFDEKKLSNITLSAESETQGSISESIDIINRGSTVVNLPENIVVCDHSTGYHISDDYVSGYHYSKCPDCYEVLDYEEHDLTSYKVCNKCGYYDDNVESTLFLDLGNEQYSEHFVYETNKEGVVVYAYLTSMQNIGYDSNTNGYTYRCADRSCDLIVKAYSVIDVDLENPCLSIYDYTYEFYQGDETTPFKTFNYKNYYVYHDWSYEYKSIDPNDPCKIIEIRTCNECGYSSTSYFHSHDYEDTITVEGCNIHHHDVCADCGYTHERVEICHSDLVFEENISNSKYRCSCSSCHEEFVGSYYISSIGAAGHFVSTDRHQFSGFMPHVFDENGTCVDCGYSSSDVSYDYRSLLFSKYEGVDYIVVGYSDTNQTIPYYIEFPTNIYIEETINENITVYTSIFSGNVIRKELLDNKTKAKFQVYIDDELALEFTSDIF